jgi:hypothetical protein
MPQHRCCPVWQDYLTTHHVYPCHSHPTYVALCSHQANLFIDPNGGIALLSTHEKIFVSPYR